jgi:DNA repair protein RecO (recombination protein O)
VQSVLARGARRSHKRYGSALDLFASGSAQIHTKPGRDLNTLSGFDVTRSPSSLAEDLGRFTAASALAEMFMRFARDDTNTSLYDSLVWALESVAAAAPPAVRGAALAGAWRMVGELGFAPALDFCSACHADLPSHADVLFSHPAGGALCVNCARTVPGSRTLPASARDAVRGWLGGESIALDSEPAGRAHQRLLREFLGVHLHDARPMRAFDVWERARWDAA